MVWQPFRTEAIRSRRYRSRWIKVPIFFGSIKRQMGFPKTAGQEERFSAVFQPSQVADSAQSQLAIIVSGIRHFSLFAERSPHSTRIDVTTRFGVHPQLPTVIFRPIDVISIRMSAERWLTPRIGMVFDVMEHFAIGHSMVAVAGKPSGDRYGFGAVLTGTGREVNETIRITGIDTSEQAGARGATHGDVAIGVAKDDSLGCQTVYIGSFDFFHSVTAQFGAHVIRHQEENIHTLFLGVRPCRSKKHRQGGAKQSIWSQYAHGHSEIDVIKLRKNINSRSPSQDFGPVVG